MLVKERMSSPAITAPAEIPFQEALKLMQLRKIRRIPLVDDDNRLVGIVSERDLLHASPSPATSLSVWELNYLLWRLRVCDLMTTKVFTVTPETPVQVAAQLMVDKRIGGLPVVDEENHVVGVITETDIFKAFVETMNAQ
jgi:acetoin utilization protein AcuB